MTGSSSGAPRPNSCAGSAPATNAKPGSPRRSAGHLRANNFERWLLAEALDLLVDGASAILRELSGGQYDLVHDKGEFYVIDHHDAGLRRGVRTLSGGETFQASLALALALSEQLAGLSTTSASLESIVLDEGFGTLDAATLDTVAATLENLAARGDRMVGRGHPRAGAGRTGPGPLRGPQGRPVAPRSNGSADERAALRRRVGPGATARRSRPSATARPAAPSSAQVDPDVELPAGDWRPIAAPPGLTRPDVVLLVDGVRRIDARVWTGERRQSYPGIAASYAAGVVRCDLRPVRRSWPAPGSSEDCSPPARAPRTWWPAQIRYRLHRVNGAVS